MYWYSETRKPTAIDWRPEVHDSDGLLIVNGAGEQLWRPLNNPPATIASSFADENPRGFGLMQRDRIFDHYMDGVFYDRRPGLWVEPLQPFGKGAVQLIEIPTDDENSRQYRRCLDSGGTARAGQRHDLSYRFSIWQAEAPVSGALARCVATRLGNGGQPGTVRPKGRAQIHARIPRRPPHLHSVRREAGSGALRPRAEPSPISSPRPCRMMCPGTGARNST